MSALLRVDGLRARRGGADVLRGVSCAVTRGEVVALMGLSGAGKTTVLRALAGLEPFEAGEIRVDDVTLGAGRAAPPAVHRKVGMVFQFHHLFEHYTAIENVALALVHVQREARPAAEARAQALLDELGVGARARALPRELSGGEAQRVAIARALAMDPPVLLLDEPTASLDPARRGDLGRTLRTLAASGRALLMTSHDDDFVRACADRVLILADGEVVEEGTPADVLERPRHAATRALLANGD
ncbi:MAG: ATP-binding cassette domain-containing protein [Vicinamibacterales bacterium]|nr:ATP-binding cassette domain-containing protein [Vicinamibacterales bacterium]